MPITFTTVAVPHFVAQIGYKRAFLNGVETRFRLSKFRKSNGYRNIKVDVKDLKKEKFNTLEELVGAVESEIQNAINKMRMQPSTSLSA